MSEVIAIIRSQARDYRGQITPDTSIFGEIDMDSLATLALVDALKTRYGIDFLATGAPMANLRSAKDIVGIISASSAAGQKAVPDS